MLGILRPHEEAGRGVVHAAAAVDGAGDVGRVEDVAVHDIHVESLERRRIGAGTHHRAHGLAAMDEQTADVVANVAVGSGHQGRTHADLPCQVSA